MQRDDMFAKALDFVSQEARYYVADAVACQIFNLAGDLEGNTEAKDVEWFAQELYLELHPNGVRWHWEQLGPDDRARWEDEARACLRVLPRLMDRIASRCYAHAAVLRTLANAERGAYRRAARTLADDAEGGET